MQNSGRRTTAAGGERALWCLPQPGMAGIALTIGIEVDGLRARRDWHVSGLFAEPHFSGTENILFSVIAESAAIIKKIIREAFSGSKSAFIISVSGSHSKFFAISIPGSEPELLAITFTGPEPGAVVAIPGPGTKLVITPTPYKLDERGRVRSG
ncbi:MAG: hypothetical protein AAGU11_23495, partial [Syntrophobacteraceae bacterium]